jgi:hypothetical protein
MVSKNEKKAIKFIWKGHIFSHSSKTSPEAVTVAQMLGKWWGGVQMLLKQGNALPLTVVNTKNR